MKENKNNEVVKDIHGIDAALSAKETSEKIFKGEVTDEMPTVEVDSHNIVEFLVESKLLPSKSEARRLIIQGGITVNNEKVIDPNSEFVGEIILKKGKKNIYKIIIK